jgi:hypothetical protein
VELKQKETAKSDWRLDRVRWRNERLRAGVLRLSCDHGLAATGLSGDRWRRGSTAVVEQDSPSQIQLRKRHAMWLRRWAGRDTSVFRCVTRPKRRAPTNDRESEMSALAYAERLR